MKVQIKYFASVREMIGQDGEFTGSEPFEKIDRLDLLVGRGYRGL